MKNELIEILKKYNYPVRLQGSLAKEEKYPDSFFTFWNNESLDHHHYDNDPTGYVWDFTIYFFSTNPALVNSILLQVIRDLKEAGWIISGRGYDTPTDEVSHTGRAVDILYIEREQKNKN